MLASCFINRMMDQLARNTWESFCKVGTDGLKRHCKCWRWEYVQQAEHLIQLPQHTHKHYTHIENILIYREEFGSKRSELAIQPTKTLHIYASLYCNCTHRGISLCWLELLKGYPRQTVAGDVPDEVIDPPALWFSPFSPFFLAIVSVLSRVSLDTTVWLSMGRETPTSQIKQQPQRSKITVYYMKN